MLPDNPRLAWYPFFVGDWLAETLGWPFEAKAVYRALLDGQWSLGRLPARPDQLRHVAGATVAQWRVAWPYVEGKFPVAADTRQNPALEARRRTQLTAYEHRKAGALRTNAARWGIGSASVTESVTESVTDSVTDGGRYRSPSRTQIQNQNQTKTVHSPHEEGAQGRPPVVDPRGARQ